MHQYAIYIKTINTLGFRVSFTNLFLLLVIASCISLLPPGLIFLLPIKHPLVIIFFLENVGYNFFQAHVSLKI